MIRRLLSFVLALMLIVAMLPVGVSAETEEDRIISQIRRCYDLTLATEHRKSMSGLCATYVNWQMVFMGINPWHIGCNGNDEYDTYCDVAVTEGGYEVHPYSAKDYSLLGVLYEITDNGTRNAYNIAVCFEKTDTPNGQLYGHANMIHAIIDGMVYYSESDFYSIDGVSYPEGTPIVVTMEQFADLYDSWTVFEGAIEFSIPYIDRCEKFETNLWIRVSEDSMLFTQPCTAEVDKWSESVRMARQGEWFHVTNLYCNDQGEYWYQVEDEETAYLYAGNTLLMDACFDQCTVTQGTLPGVLKEGESFLADGQIQVNGCNLPCICGRIYEKNRDGFSLKQMKMENVKELTEGQHIELRNVGRELAFDELKAGDYRYELTGSAFCCFSDGEHLLRRWEAVPLSRAEFVVQTQEDQTQYCLLKFDGNGGTSELDQTFVRRGMAEDVAVKAQRDGYVFAGWSAKPTGYRSVGGQSHIGDDMILYACWEENTQQCDGWTLTNGEWYYYEDGQKLTGWQEINSIYYFLQPDGTVTRGSAVIDGHRFFFRKNGALIVS